MKVVVDVKDESDDESDDEDNNELCDNLGIFLNDFEIDNIEVDDNSFFIFFILNFLNILKSLFIFKKWLCVFLNSN